MMRNKVQVVQTGAHLTAIFRDERPSAKIVDRMVSKINQIAERFAEGKIKVELDAEPRCDVFAGGKLVMSLLYQDGQVIPTKEYPVNKAVRRGRSFIVPRCVLCGKSHVHSAGDGHVVAHCINLESSGHVLKEQPSRSVAPEAS